MLLSALAYAVSIVLASRTYGGTRANHWMRAAEESAVTRCMSEEIGLRQYAYVRTCLNLGENRHRN